MKKFKISLVAQIAIALLLGFIVGMGRTTMSVTCDASCAVVMEHLERSNKNL